MSLNSTNILLIDDNKGECILLTFALRQAGLNAQIQQSFNFEDVKKSVKTFNADVCLVDINMPPESGYAILKWLNENTKIPCIMYSNSALDKDVVLSEKMGARKYIKKSAKPEKIAEAIKETLKR